MQQTSRSGHSVTASPVTERYVDTAAAESGDSVRPVVWWALLGAAFVLFVLYVQGRWLLTQAHHVGTGVTPVPTYAKVSIWALQIIFGAGSLACLYGTVVRPKWRDGRIGFNGLLCLAFIFVWWTDPLTNLFSNGFAYNSEFLNLGGWGQNIPGFDTLNANQSATPIIWNLGFYLFGSYLLCVQASSVMSRAKAHWPALRTPVMLAWCFVGLFIVDFAMEFFFVVTGCYAYGGVRASWTLFTGHYYQFPIYEPILAAASFMTWICLVHFKNARGETFVERGLDRVRIRPAGKQGLRFLALVAGLNLCFLFSYFAAMDIFQHNVSTWPADLQKRSYMTHDMCGQGTTVICGGTSLRIGPDGQVVVPAHAQIPDTVPLQR